MNTGGGPRRLSKNIGGKTATPEDIHNLVDSPDTGGGLGIIDEDGQGVSPLKPTSVHSGRKLRGGLTRLTTEEFAEQKDLIKMQQKPEFIRRESI